MSYNFIKQRLITILNSDQTKSFYKDHFGKIPITASNPILNFIIDGVFANEKNIKIEENNQGVYIIIINNKKIMIRLHSFDTKNKRFIIKSFKYEREENVIIENVIDEINFILGNYDYIFFIRAEEELASENEEGKFKACYHYYLIPMEIYKINEKEREIILLKEEERMEAPISIRKSRASYSGKTWIFKDFIKFYIKYNIRMLDKYNIGFPYINC